MSRPFTPIHVMTEAFRKAMYDIVAKEREKRRHSTTQEQTPAPQKTGENCPQ